MIRPSARRYSLQLTEEGGKAHIIELKEDGVLKTKVDLNTIDMFTTSFDNEADLAEYIMFNNKNIKSCVNIVITYHHNSTTKHLKAVYDNSLINYFSNRCFYDFEGEKGVKINLKNDEMNLYNRFIDYVLNNEEYCEEVLDKPYYLGKYMTAYFKDLMSRDLSKKNYSKKCIKNSMLNYKQLRGLIIALNEGEYKKIEKLSVIEAEEWHLYKENRRKKLEKIIFENQKQYSNDDDVRDEFGIYPKNDTPDEKDIIEYKTKHGTFDNSLIKEETKPGTHNSSIREETKRKTRMEKYDNIKLSENVRSKNKKSVSDGDLEQLYFFKTKQ